jgi:integrase
LLVGSELRLPGRVMKNKKPLTLPLSGRLLEVFARRWAARIESCPWIFHRKERRLARFTAVWDEATTAIGRGPVSSFTTSGAQGRARCGAPVWTS